MPIGTVVIALAAAAVIAAADGWRMAALAVIAAGSVLLTRARFASELAAAVLLAVAVLAFSGHSVGLDIR